MAEEIRNLFLFTPFPGAKDFSFLPEAMRCSLWTGRLYRQPCSVTTVTRWHHFWIPYPRSLLRSSSSYRRAGRCLSQRFDISTIRSPSRRVLSRRPASALLYGLGPDERTGHVD